MKTLYELRQLARMRRFPAFRFPLSAFLLVLSALCGEVFGQSFNLIVQVQSSSINPTNAGPSPTNYPNWKTGLTFTNRVARSNGCDYFGAGKVVLIGPIEGLSQELSVRTFRGPMYSITNSISNNVGVCSVQSTRTNWYRTKLLLR